MAEFVFRNLSMRLVTDDGAADDVAEACVDLYTFCDADHTCFEPMSCDLNSVCGFCTLCTVQTCGTPLTEQVTKKASPAEVRAELAAHKERLGRVIAQIEEREQALDAQARPMSLEEIDQLRAGLVAAIAELDERRAGLTTGQDPDPE